MPSQALNKGKGEFPVSLTILTHIRGLINTLTQLISLPRWLGPLITFIAIALNQQAILFGLFPPQVAWLYVPVAFAAASGLRSGLASAALVGLYSIWLDPGEVQRTIIVPLSVMTLAGLVGWQTRALRQSVADELAQHSRADANQEARKIVDSLNGNIIRVTEAREQLLNILERDLLTEETRNRLRSVLHTLNNLATATEGWRELREIRERIASEPIAKGNDKPGDTSN